MHVHTNIVLHISALMSRGLPMRGVTSVHLDPISAMATLEFCPLLGLPCPLEQLSTNQLVGPYVESLYMYLWIFCPM